MSLHTNYGLLTTKERLRLAVEAQARGDGRETNRLFGTVPVVPLVGPPADFVKQTAAVSAVNSFVGQLIAERLGQLRGLVIGAAASDVVLLNRSADWFEEQTSLLAACPPPAEAEDAPDEDDAPVDLKIDEPVIDYASLTQPMVTRLVAELAAVRAAVDDFARDALGLSGDTLLRSASPHWADELQMEPFRQLIPCPETKHAISDHLWALWQSCQH